MLMPASDPADLNNGSDGGGGDGHSCLRTVMLSVRKNAHHVKEQEETVKSQSILIAKLIRELEEVKKRLQGQEKESSRLKDQMEKVILSQASLTVEPEHKSLIARLKQDAFITSEKVHQIMLSVDFKDFNQDSVTPNKRFVCCYTSYDRTVRACTAGRCCCSKQHEEGTLH